MVDRVHSVHMQGRFCLYKLTEEDEDAWDELAETGLYRVSRGIPSNNSIQVLIRVYVVSVRHFTFLQIKSRLLKLGIYLCKKLSISLSVLNTFVCVIFVHLDVQTTK